MPCALVLICGLHSAEARPYVLLGVLCLYSPLSSSSSILVDALAMDVLLNDLSAECSLAERGVAADAVD